MKAVKRKANVTKTHFTFPSEDIFFVFSFIIKLKYTIGESTFGNIYESICFTILQYKIYLKFCIKFLQIIHLIK